MRLTAATEVPLDPDADQAREWLILELAKPEYAAARPTLFDQIADAILRWIQSVLQGLQPVSGAGSTGLMPLILIVLFAAALIIAFLIFGVPRLNRRSRVAPGSLFGDDDDRNGAQLRAAAESAAAQGDYSTAIAEMFRATARGLAERTIVTTHPGTTASGFAGAAGLAFPDSAEALRQSAATFDDVRYLARPGTEEAYRFVAELERTLRKSRTPAKAATA